MLYFPTTDSIVGLFTQHPHKHASNALHCDVTMATTSLGNRNFSAPLECYGSYTPSVVDRNVILHLMTILTLLLWSGTQPTISPRYACI